MSYIIPFNKPCFEGNEQAYMAQAVANGHISGDGPFTKQCDTFLEREIGRPQSSPDHILHACPRIRELILLDIQPGDEVIVPSFTFVSTINAFVLRGAWPVFVDIRPDTLSTWTRHSSSGTSLRVPRRSCRCIMPALAARWMRSWRSRKRHGIAVVEDNAHGLFGKYEGRYLGTFGVHGDAELPRDEEFHLRRGWRAAHQRSALSSSGPRSSARRARIAAASSAARWTSTPGSMSGRAISRPIFSPRFCSAQLEARETIQAKRQRMWEYYKPHLARLGGRARGAACRSCPTHCEQPYHMFYLLLPSLAAGTALIAHLEARGILERFPLSATPRL